MENNLQKIAQDIRKKFEQKQIAQGELAQIYSAYNPAVNGMTFVVEAEKLFPRLNCGLTTAYLQKILGGEIVQGRFKDWNHTYLLVDGFVVDITADQYGGPKVYVGEWKFPWTRRNFEAITAE